MEAAELILAEARRLGFAAAGIATAGPAQTMPAFDAWIASGRAAGMDYLRRRAPLRADPARLLPGVRGIVVVAARYPTPDECGDRVGAGFSTYARGDDYHDVIRAKLRALAAVAVNAGGPIAPPAAPPRARYRICVDSAPLLEREWAVRAGVGWLGRQGQVVNAQAGCCLLLGALLLDIALPPTPAATNRCGDCQRCVDACPTGAIGPDAHVDARRCLSYLTIEHDGDIPAEWAGRLGGTLFGCDRCTAVCPFNRHGADLVMPELRAKGPRPDAAEILDMTPGDFDRRFAGTAVHRGGLARLRRNARLVGPGAPPPPRP